MLSSCTRRSPRQISNGGWLCTCAPDRSIAGRIPSPPLLSSSHLFVITLPSPIPQFRFSFPIIAVCQLSAEFEPRQAPSTLSPIFQLLFRNLAIVTPDSRPFLLDCSVSAKTQNVFRSLRLNQSNLQVQSYTTISPSYHYRQRS